MPCGHQNHHYAYIGGNNNSLLTSWSGHDLDTLIPVLNEEDLHDMIFKYDRVSHFANTSNVEGLLLPCSYSVGWRFNYTSTMTSAEEGQLFESIIQKLFNCFGLLLVRLGCFGLLPVRLGFAACFVVAINTIGWKKKKIIHEHKNKNLSVSMHLKLSSNLFAMPSLILVTKIILWFNKKKN